MYLINDEVLIEVKERPRATINELLTNTANKPKTLFNLTVPGSIYRFHIEMVEWNNSVL